jgi:hypothetical protein
MPVVVFWDGKPNRLISPPSGGMARGAPSLRCRCDFRSQPSKRRAGAEPRRHRNHPALKRNRDMLGIRVLDHVVLDDERFFSLQRARLAIDTWTVGT